MYLDTISAPIRAKVEPVGDRAMLMTKAMLPASITVVQETIAPNGESGTLKIKGLAASLMASGQKMNYGTIELVKEAGVWKVGKQTWSETEGADGSKALKEIQEMRSSSCKGVTGLPESLPDQAMVQLQPSETQIAKFSVPPNGSKDIRYPSQGPQQTMFRIAMNQALRCKYQDDYPAGMSIDGGKKWLYSFAAGQAVTPVNGSINLMFKNNGQEVLNFLVVTTTAR